MSQVQDNQLIFDFLRNNKKIVIKQRIKKQFFTFLLINQLFISQLIDQKQRQKLQHCYKKFENIMKSECHLCQMTVQNLAKCTKTRCRNFFCEKCIQENFDAGFVYHVSYKEGCWVCYACQNACSCRLCKGEILLYSKKSLAKRKNKLVQMMESSSTVDKSSSQTTTIQQLEKERDSSDDLLSHHNDYEKRASQDENEVVQSSFKYSLKQPRLLNQKITKSLPSHSKEYHSNKFYRRKMLLKAS
ncbi:hypothetical protein TTHERM_00361420 (macronuclear) [Tetrahymena thermophila SB210]|uniref:Uncharacterized protein n=1 Tax=Tetrahymena thermophila (strain SB210) TaxID=312017 RepID=Q22PK2_TETTS|nr:hypothetical protein TTHERM_00361420 [Tetrahymena thermophila SB210]EAR87107.2 hypothetical protein TTHERM_00361420 [Tetrahymena thermophila SB210]|eukprot:XP_001007352.2 hypothetical protein TTHERM_00361420 [Tetrahymena thermophila SB210]